MRVLAFVSVSLALLACGASTTSSDQCDAQSCLECTGSECARDQVAPLIEIVAPAAQALINANSVEVSANVLDASEIATVEVSIDQTTFTPMTRDSGLFTAHIPTPMLDGRAVTITVRAIDAAGNGSNAEVQVTVDRLAPALSLASPENGMVFTARDPLTFLIQGSVSDAMLEKVEIKLDELAPEEIEVFEGNFRREMTLANEDGVEHTVRVRAVDRAGNETSVEHIYSVDRISPKVATLPVQGQRYVDCTATLLTFSEPMDVNSVRQATTLNGIMVGASFGSIDGISFHFSDCKDVPAYTELTLAVEKTARDRSGNQLQARSVESFQSKPISPSVNQVIGNGRFPSLAVDRDGNPFVAYWDPISSNFKVSWWNGRDRFESQPLTVPGPGFTKPCARPVYLTLTDRLPPPGELTLHRDVQIVFCGQTPNEGYNSSRYGDLYYANMTQDTFAKPPALKIEKLDARASVAGSPRIRGECEEQVSHVVTYARFVDDGAGDSWDEVWQRSLEHTGQWQPAQRLHNPGVHIDLGGDAFLPYGRDSVVFFPFDTPKTFNAPNGGSVFGSLAFCMPGDLLRSSFLVWSTREKPTPKVFAACTEGALASGWKQSLNITPSSEEIRAVHFELGSPDSAIAIETTRNEVFTARIENGYCQAAPGMPDWSTPIISAREPAVRVVDGKLWTVVVDSSSEQMRIAP